MAMKKSANHSRKVSVSAKPQSNQVGTRVGSGVKKTSAGNARTRGMPHSGKGC